MSENLGNDCGIFDGGDEPQWRPQRLEEVQDGRAVIAGTTLADETVEAFQAAVRGQVLRPGVSGYDEARTISRSLL